MKVIPMLVLTGITETKGKPELNGDKILMCPS